MVHEDDPSEQIWFRSVKEIAQKNNIPVRTPKKIDETELAVIKEAGPELVFSFYYRAMALVLAGITLLSIKG